MRQIENITCFFLWMPICLAASLPEVYFWYVMLCLLWMTQKNGDKRDELFDKQI